MDIIYFIMCNILPNELNAISDSKHRNNHSNRSKCDFFFSHKSPPCLINVLLLQDEEPAGGSTADPDNRPGDVHSVLTGTVTIAFFLSDCLPLTPSTRGALYRQRTSCFIYVLYTVDLKLLLRIRI